MTERIIEILNIMVTPVHLRHSYIMLRILTHLSYLQGKLLFFHGISFFSIFFFYFWYSFTLFQFDKMDCDPQASGASAQNNGVGAPLPPLQEGRNWDRLFDLLMENSTRQDLVLQQYGGRLGLLEDVQRQTEAGETI